MGKNPFNIEEYEDGGQGNGRDRTDQMPAQLLDMIDEGHFCITTGPFTEKTAEETHYYLLPGAKLGK